MSIRRRMIAVSSRDHWVVPPIGRSETFLTPGTVPWLAPERRAAARRAAVVEVECVAKQLSSRTSHSTQKFATPLGGWRRAQVN